MHCLNEEEPHDMTGPMDIFTYDLKWVPNIDANIEKLAIMSNRNFGKNYLTTLLA